MTTTATVLTAATSQVSHRLFRSQPHPGFALTVIPHRHLGVPQLALLLHQRGPSAGLHPLVARQRRHLRRGVLRRQRRDERHGCVPEPLCQDWQAVPQEAGRGAEHPAGSECGAAQSNESTPDGRTRDGQGSKIRDRYISDSKKHLESTSAEIAKLEVELEVAKEKESRLRASLERAERADRGVIEKKKASRECWSGRRRNGAD